MIIDKIQKINNEDSINSAFIACDILFKNIKKHRAWAIALDTNSMNLLKACEEGFLKASQIKLSEAEAATNKSFRVIQGKAIAKYLAKSGHYEALSFRISVAIYTYASTAIKVACDELDYFYSFYYENSLDLSLTEALLSYPSKYQTIALKYLLNYMNAPEFPFMWGKAILALNHCLKFNLIEKETILSILKDMSNHNEINLLAKLILESQVYLGKWDIH